MENELNDIKSIGKAPEISHLESKKSNIEEFPNFSNLVTYFKKTLRTHLTEEQMSIVTKNLETLQYSPSGLYKSITDRIKGRGGAYSEHQITVNMLSTSDITHILLHELLHASTSSYTKDKAYCGLAQIDLTTREEIGRAINEGYTELLTRRLFGYNSKEGYNYEVAVAEMIEFIVGKDKMQDYYFKLDLNSLITELAQYSDIEKIVKFLQNLDKASKAINQPHMNNTSQSQSNPFTEVDKYLKVLFEKAINPYLNPEKHQELKKQIEINTAPQRSPKRIATPKEMLKKAKTTLINFKKAKEYAQTNIKNQRPLNSVQTNTPVQRPLNNMQTSTISRPTQNISKPKTLVRKKPTNTSVTKINGFIDIITITTILAIISSISIVFSYLILQAR